MSDSDQMKHQRPVLEDALRVIGPRPQPSKEGTSRAYARAHQAWRAMTHERMQRRQRRTLAARLAASILFAVLGFASWYTLRAPESVATVALAQGSANYVGAQGAQSSVRERDTVHAGAIIETTDRARLALGLFSGHSLRLDHATRVAIVGATEFRLERGRVYVDSGAAENPPPLRIDAPFATVTDIGTQFQVTASPDALRVQVREGSVSLRAANESATTSVMAGEIVSLTSAHAMERSSGAAFGSEWAWVAAVAPGLDEQERRLDRVLAWVCRELGYELRYADARTEASVRQVVLDGSFAGLTPEQTLEVLQNITAFRYRRESGELMLESF